MLEAPFQISKTRLLLPASRLIWIWPVACPELSSIILQKLPVNQKGLNQLQIENAGPIVMVGMVMNSLSVFAAVLVKPPDCSK
jgi:hypothetical protein